MPKAAPKETTIELTAATGDGLEIQAASSDSDKPATFTMVAYNGGPMRLPGWVHPVVADLAGLQISAQQRPVLRDHKLGLIAGHTTKIEKTGSQLTAEGVLSGGNEHAAQVAASARNGFPWQASIGAAVNRVEFVANGSSQTVNGKTITGPAYIARQSTLKEISFVAIGADDSTSARVTAQASSEGAAMSFNEWLKANGFDPDTITDTQSTKLRAAYDAEHGTGGADTVTAVRESAAGEAERINAIRAKCSGYPEIETRAIREGWSTEKAELATLRASRGNAPYINTGEGGADQGQALEAALCITAGVPEKQLGEQYDEKTMNAATSSQYRSAGIHAAIYATLSAAGRAGGIGRIDDTTIRAAFDADRMIQASPGFSTVGLSGILGNVANKAMLSVYRSVATTWRQIAAVGTNSNFKPHKRYRLIGKGSFEKLGGQGELKHITLDEQDYQTQLETRGALITLSRKDDDRRRPRRVHGAPSRARPPRRDGHRIRGVHAAAVEPVELLQHRQQQLQDRRQHRARHRRADRRGASVHGSD